jgi:hypothetical protein
LARVLYNFSILNTIMKQIFILVVTWSVFAVTVQAQKTVSELTVFYENTIETKGDKPNVGALLNGATTTTFIKGNNHRTDQVNSLGTSTTIYDSKTNSAVVLKEFGKQKILVRLNSKNLAESNKKYVGVTFTKGTETKIIAGYNCTVSTGKFNDGTTFTVYATKDIVPENKDYNAQFKDVDGLVLQYEFSAGTTKIITTATKVLLAPIAPTKFDIPKSGYREMTYEESIK